MEKIYTIVWGGLAGGVIFLLAMHLLRVFKVTTANPVHTLGSIFFEKPGAQAVAGFLSFFAGALVFAFAEGFLLNMFPGYHIFMLAFVGAFIGFAQGIVVTLATADIVAKKHPLPEYQTLPFPAALSYVIAHVLFGITMGFTVGLG
jgi:hypothetical protein